MTTATMTRVEEIVRQEVERFEPMTFTDPTEVVREAMANCMYCIADFHTERAFSREKAASAFKSIIQLAVTAMLDLEESHSLEAVQ